MYLVTFHCCLWSATRVLVRSHREHVPEALQLTALNNSLTGPYKSNSRDIWRCTVWMMKYHMTDMTLETSCLTQKLCCGRWHVNMTNRLPYPHPNQPKPRPNIKGSVHQNMNAARQMQSKGHLVVCPLSLIIAQAVVFCYCLPSLRSS